MVVRGVEKIKRFFTWVLLWYSLEAIFLFLVFIGYWVSSKINMNAPINVFFILSMGSLLWPGFILVFFITGITGITDASLTPIFLVIFGSIMISSITSIMIEYKYKISYSVLFILLRRRNDKIIREMFAWLFVWYLFEVMSMFSLLLLTLPVSKASDPINVLVTGSIVSIFWPIIIIVMFFLVDASINPFFLVIFGSTIIFLIVSPIIKYKFNFSYSKVFDFLEGKKS